jgi:hypothetical protein
MCNLDSGKSLLDKSEEQWFETRLGYTHPFPFNLVPTSHLTSQVLKVLPLEFQTKKFTEPSFFTFVKGPCATILSTHVLRIVAKGHLTTCCPLLSLLLSYWWHCSIVHPPLLSSSFALVILHHHCHHSKVCRLPTLLSLACVPLHWLPLSGVVLWGNNAVVQWPHQNIPPNDCHWPIHLFLNNCVHLVVTGDGAYCHPAPMTNARQCQQCSLKTLYTSEQPWHAVLLS